MSRVVKWVLAGLLIGVIAVAWFLRQSPESAGSASEQKPELGSDGLVEHLQQEVADATPEPPESISPAKRIRHGTAAGGELENADFELPASGDEKAERLARQAEAALGGDVDALVELTRLLSECDPGMDSMERVQERLDRMAEFNARNPGGPMMPGRDGGSVEFRSFEDIEADMWARYDRCQVARGVLDESLYEQVCRLAESGVPSARYLYAVWPPDQDGLIDLDTLELLEYQSLALEYTWLNMQARDPLGLLAMAQSYAARRPSMFTPSNPVQGQVFLLASMKCGIDNEWLQERSVNFGQGFGRFQARNMEMPSLDEDATALAEMFCPASGED